MIKYNDPYLLNENYMIRFMYPDTKINFYKFKNSPEISQFIDIDDISNIVWYDLKKLNKFNEYPVIRDLTTDPEITLLSLQDSVKFELLVKQGYNWSSLYGIHVIIKGSQTGNVYISRLFKVDDFTITDNKVLRFGSFWMERSSANIPSHNNIVVNNSAIDEELFIQITEITSDDIASDPVNYGLIYNYPVEYQPLVLSKPFPDTIKTNLRFDSNLFLNIFTYTEENKTLERAIKDYFGILPNEIIPIEIYYVLETSGVNQDTGLTEYEYLRVSNDENNLNPLNVGLNFNKWIDITNSLQQFLVNCTTHIKIDNKVMMRETSITFDFSSNIIGNIINPIQSINEINIVETINVQQTVIENPEKIKIVKVIQPVYVEMITKDFKYERKNIYLPIDEAAYMIVGSGDKIEKITNMLTSDGKYYYDLTMLTPISENIEYNIYTVKDDRKVLTGNITV